MTSSIFWYDYETTGINPRADRPLQMAGIRTDHDLNEIEAPINLYCKLSDDILPHPAACLITGITPQRLLDHGLDEAEFMSRVHTELARPGTCGAGYNTLRFDDEVTRYSLYRNFFDPYAREWQGGNSRWDLIDIVRCAYALRPEGIEWPHVEGRVSLKLELLTKANGIDHGQAHDALSDVRATIGLARLIRDRQPKLYEWLFKLRTKQKVQEQIRLMQPLVHISGRFGAERNYLAVVLPVAWHPRNKNALIVVDLHLDPSVILNESAEVLRERLYTPREQLLDGQLPVPLKQLHINRCPVVAPLNVLRPEDRLRLNLDVEALLERAARLSAAEGEWREKVVRVFEGREFSAVDDPEQQLYDGFIGDRDRRLCEQVRECDPSLLGRQNWMFDDPRLPELLMRYRARNYPHTLNEVERQQWLHFCQERLRDPAHGAPLGLHDFELAMQEWLPKASGVGLQVLNEWQQFVRIQAEKLGM